MKNKWIQIFVALWYIGFMFIYYCDDKVTDRKFMLMGIIVIIAYMLVLDMVRKEVK